MERDQRRWVVKRWSGVDRRRGGTSVAREQLRCEAGRSLWLVALTGTTVVVNDYAIPPVEIGAKEIPCAVIVVCASHQEQRLTGSLFLEAQPSPVGSYREEHREPQPADRLAGLARVSWIADCTAISAGRTRLLAERRGLLAEVGVQVLQAVADESAGHPQVIDDQLTTCGEGNELVAGAQTCQLVCVAL